MAIITFEPGITIPRISEVAVTTPITAQVANPITIANAPNRPTVLPPGVLPPGTFTPPVVTPAGPTPPVVVNPTHPTVPLAPPFFQWPPNQGPVSNIIVEGPTQRGENSFPWSGTGLTRQMPPESNPYRMLPENYIMEQWGEYLPEFMQTKFYNLERPLDLLRYKSDRYWNVLSYQGGYALNQGEVDIIPIASITYLSPNKGPHKFEVRRGSIIDAFDPTLRREMGGVGNNPGGTNFTGFFLKEVILLQANYNVFSASAPTAPPPPQTFSDAVGPTTAANFGERTRRELGRGRFRGDIGGGFTGGGIGGGGYP